jgi:nucleoside triphosphate pyrophosphatase
MSDIVLASASQARIALLSAAGIDFTAMPAAIDERAVEAPLLAEGATPTAIAVALAEAKALAASAEMAEAVVIGADQTLDLDGAVLTKPKSLAEARQQLARLSDRTHELQTAVAVACGGMVIWRHQVMSRLTMRRLSASFIDGYLARVGEAALTSVGAYQIEGAGIQLFDRIEGDYFAILGLPLLPLLKWLREAGALEGTS